MQQGGPPYGVLPPQHQQQAELSPFHLVGSGGAAEAAPPISTRPPPPQGAGAPSNYEELGAGEDPLGPPGDEGGSGGLTGNRWPRQETLALLKIRSDMDATFRDATLKGPLWEEVSRKLGELGYRRSSKKCKEKFENVHKYYKRTKEGRAGRQDGKSYRFFSQLEALHNTTATASLLSSAPQSMATTLTAFSPNSQTPDPNPNQSGTAVTRTMHPMQISTPTPITTAPPNPQPNPMRTLLENPNVPGSAAGGTAAGIGFSSNTSSSDGSESEDDDDDDEATEEGPCSGRKRKRESGGGGSKKMMSFFEGLMRQVMERQESMQRRFLEAIEKREQDRMIRDEAWRRQEMSRTAREHELASQERAAAASRDAAIISFLQKVTGQTVQFPPPPIGVSSSPTTTNVIQTPPNPPPPSQILQTPLQPPPQQQQQQSTEPARYHQPITPPAQQPSTEAVRHRQPITPPAQQPSTEAVRHHQPITPPAPQPSTESVRHREAITPPPLPPPASSELFPVGPSDAHEGAMVSVSLDPASSRWPKSEVHALIKLRSELDSRYQESGPKGPLWEEISTGMQRLGYNRSSKRCKEKWENINKYFKKVKESNKKRPEDAKTCPYFHQLDALYRNKHNNSGGGGGSSGGGSMPVQLTHQNSNLNPNIPSPIRMIAPPQVQHPGEMDSKSGNGGNAAQNSAGSSNGGIESNFFGEGTTNRGGGDNGGIMKKPEDIMKELMGHSTNDDYGNLNEAKSDNMDEDDEEEDDEGDEDGKGQYRIQFQNVGNNASNGASPNTGGKTAGTFLAMVR